MFFLTNVPIHYFKNMATFSLAVKYPGMYISAAFESSETEAIQNIKIWPTKHADDLT